MRVLITKAHADWAPILREQLIRLEETDKYMSADRCGISEASQAELIEYREQVRRIDHNFDHPDHVIWPEQPVPRKDQ